MPSHFLKIFDLTKASQTEVGGIILKFPKPIVKTNKIKKKLTLLKNWGNIVHCFGNFQVVFFSEQI